MLKPAFFVAAFFATSLATSTFAQSTQPARLGLPEVNNARLTELAAQVVLLHDVPGLGIAVVDKGGLYAFGAAGVRKAGAPDRLTTEDMFHLGACGKVMTAVMLGRLTDAGKLSLTKPLSELLPKEEMAGGFRSLTLLDLLRHRSGIAGAVDREQLPFLRAGARDPQASRANLAQRIFSAAPGGDKGKFEYSDVNYALAGYVAENVTGVAFEQLMRDEVFGPLDMTTAGFGAPTGKQPVGHRVGALPVEPGPYADFPAGLSPAGTVHCSMRDWARFSAVLLGGKKEFIKPETLALLTGAPEDAKTGDAERPAYGSGVSATSTLGNVTYSHTGSNTLWFAQFHMFPSAGWGILIATNQGGTNGEKAIDEVTKEILALSPR